jgi:glycerol-3-phosphate dehydrogenase
MLGLPEVIAAHEADFDIASALDEAAHVVATIPEEFQTSVTQQMQERVTSLAQRAERAFAIRHAIQLG